MRDNLLTAKIFVVLVQYAVGAGFQSSDESIVTNDGLITIAAKGKGSHQPLRFYSYPHGMASGVGGVISVRNSVHFMLMTYLGRGSKLIRNHDKTNSADPGEGILG
jgi:hypothetical protein